MFFLQVLFVLLSVCCLRPTLTLALTSAYPTDQLQDHKNAAVRALNARPGWDDPMNNECELCPSRPYTHNYNPDPPGYEEEEEETEVVTTMAPTPDTDPVPSSNNNNSNNNSMQETSPGSLNGMEILVAVFFCIAAVWLAAAVLYSILLLFVLRLRSQGRLNISDENFGQVSCCCVKLQLAFLLRRYAIQVDPATDTSGGGTDGNGNGNGRASSQQLMTRSERRIAMEVVLLKNKNPSKQLVVAPASEPACCTSTLCCVNEDDKNDEDDETKSIEEPCCTICLGEYGTWLVDKSGVILLYS